MRRRAALIACLALGACGKAPALKGPIAKETSAPTITEGRAAEICSLALKRRLGRTPVLILQETFPDGGRFFVEGGPGSAASRANCFIEKDGRISKLRAVFGGN
jgi:hypothetical protein